MYDMLEGVNLYLGNDSPNLKGSTHLEIETLKLPDLEAMTTPHTPGGGVMGINFAIPTLSALVFPFRLKGMNPDRLVEFGYGGFTRRHYTGFGSVRNKRTGVSQSATIVIEGVMTKLTSNAYSKGDGVDFDYEVNEVWSYMLTVGNRPVFDIDYATNKCFIDGIDVFADINRNLRVPTA